MCNVYIPPDYLFQESKVSVKSQVAKSVNPPSKLDRYPVSIHAPKC